MFSSFYQNTHRNDLSAKVNNMYFLFSFPPGFRKKEIFSNFSAQVIVSDKNMGDKESRDLQKCLQRTPNKKKPSVEKDLKIGDTNDNTFSYNEWLKNKVREEEELEQKLKQETQQSENGTGNQSEANADNETEKPTHSHPVYHTISILNGKINRMDLSQVG